MPPCGELFCYILQGAITKSAFKQSHYIWSALKNLGKEQQGQKKHVKAEKKSDPDYKQGKLSYLVMALLKTTFSPRKWSCQHYKTGFTESQSPYEYVEEKL